MMKLEQKYLHLVDSDRLRYATGIISTREAVRQVLAELESSDFPVKRVSVFPVDVEHKNLNQNADAEPQIITPIEGAKAGAVTGGVAGGVAGGLLALTVGLGALVIPGVGPALAVESVLSTLLASGASATFGSVVGYLHGWFAPEKQASFYAASLAPPEFWVMIEGTADQIRQAEAILRYWQVREWRVYQQLDSI